MDIDGMELWRILEHLLVNRDLPDGCQDDGDEDLAIVFRDTLRADIWRAAIDRATFGLAVAARVIDGEMTADRAASFLGESETDPDGLRDALRAFLDRV